MLSSSRVRRAVAVLLMVAALGACSTEDMIRVAFADRGASPAQQEQAIEVARCESGLNPGAVSPGGGNWGLFQINTVHKARVAKVGWGWHEIVHPWQNATVAADLWAEQGWGPWTCARNLGIR